MRETQPCAGRSKDFGEIEISTGAGPNRETAGRRRCQEKFHLQREARAYVLRSFDARMAELADALDSKSSSERSVGSTPTLGTKASKRRLREGKALEYELWRSMLLIALSIRTLDLPAFYCSAAKRRIICSRSVAAWGPVILFPAVSRSGSVVGP